jgi:hypothetical protein
MANAPALPAAVDDQVEAGAEARGLAQEGHGSVLMAADVRRIRRRPGRYGGCEVMPSPNVVLSRRDAAGCHWFEPIDRLDAQGREPPRSFYRAA